MLRFLCAAICAAFLSLAGCSSGDQGGLVVPPPRHEAGAELIEQLRGGGYALVARHANSPAGQEDASGLSEGCNLAPGRGLDAVGREQAATMNKFLTDEGIPVLKAYTSDLCRAWDTASLAIGAAVFPHPAQKTTDADVIAKFKKDIEVELAANPGQNILLTSHSNVAPLYGARARADEEELPSGVLYAVSPATWETVTRIDLRDEYGPGSVSPQ
jgi:broad specificity phosphatase PhoE